MSEEDERLAGSTRKLPKRSEATPIAMVEKRAKEEAYTEVARRMKQKGYPVADIMEMTGLSASDIENL